MQSKVWSAKDAELRKARFLPQAKMAYEKDSEKKEFNIKLFAGACAVVLTFASMRFGFRGSDLKITIPFKKERTCRLSC